MAKRKTETTSRANEPDAEVLKRLFGAIFDAQTTNKSIMMTAAADCKPGHQKIRDAKEGLRGAGVSAAVIAATLKEHRARQTIENARASLEDGDISLGKITREAIGLLADLPLGKAAIKRAEKDDAERDLRPPFLGEGRKPPTSREKRVAENVVALTGKGGITPLDTPPAA
jgi:hypothetical protein